MRLTSFDQVLAQLDSLPDTPKVGAALAHCAQSIEFSITGFPQQRAWLIRAVIGPRVLKKFLKQGFMSHDLSAPILGAPEISATTTLGEGRDRLKAAVTAFRAHGGAYAPHFAYGPVAKAEYEAVQSMHIADHLSSFST